LSSIPSSSFKKLGRSIGDQAFLYAQMLDHKYTNSDDLYRKFLSYFF